MFIRNFNQESRDHVLPSQNTTLKKSNMVVGRGKENKQKSRNISLATDENQYIYSYDKLVIKPTLAYC